MKSIFDFDSIRKLIKGSGGKPPFNILIDSMNGGMVNYLKYESQNLLNKIYLYRTYILFCY